MLSREKIFADLVASYNSSAKEYATGRAPEEVTNFIAEQLDFFVSQFPARTVSSKVLDLGSGPGDGSKYLRDKFGITPECIDISPAMLELCAGKGLPVRREDFSNLSDLDHSVAGVFMNFSFLHIPKVEAPVILQEIRRILCPNGVLQITLFEGQGEGFEEKTKYKYPRFFAYYQQHELRHVIEDRFTVVNEAKLKNKPRNLLSITGKAS